MVELLGRSLCLDIPCVEPDLGADFEFGWGDSARFRCADVLLNGSAYLLLEILVEGGEVFCYLLRCVRGHIVDSDFELRVVTLVSEERRDLCGGMRGVVVCELRQG